MGYEPIKVIASAASADGHVNRITEFDDVPQSNKLSYRDGFPILTATPNGQNTRGPRRVDLNGIFYLFSNNLFELQQGNFPTYNSAIVGAGKPLPDGYPLGAVLWYPTGGYFVKSLIADNTESDLTDTTKWAKITVSAAELATGLSGKVDTDLSNLPLTQKNNIVSYLEPDYTAGVTIYPPYVPSENGLIVFSANPLEANIASTVYVNDTVVMFKAVSGVSWGHYTSLYVFQGQTITWTNMTGVEFFPLKINQ